MPIRAKYENFSLSLSEKHAQNYKKKKTGMVTTYRIADFVNYKLLIYVL